ncbi:MAG TPA: c-type cytochrome biogenesis protein CcsB [Candidatus Lumbricidophila sp.]|nr:c-type cytochrome biogenesis protein CcsB [Candidatus Lumbricidophila sp.]
MNLDQISIVAVYSALAVYALAFLAFAADLLKATRADAVEASGANAAPRRSLARIAVALTVVAWLLHLSADVLRGVAAGRVPWANMYEFAVTGTLMVVTVFLVVLKFAKLDLRFLGSFVLGLVLLLLGAAAVNFYREIAPLPPALQDIWLVIHVFVASTSVGFYTIGCGLSVVQLLQARREARAAAPAAVKIPVAVGAGADGAAGSAEASGGVSTKRLALTAIPNSQVLENLAFRVTVVGFILWTFTLMAGAIWAEKAWGRYWGWDTKEVWTFIIWVIYAGYLHARSTRGWAGTRSAWLAIIGFAAVMFNFTIVNMFFKGLHTYSGL